MTMNPQKPSWEQLLDWIEGRLSEQVAAHIAAQIAEADPDLTKDVDWLRAFGRIQRKLILEEPPSQVRNSIVERFDAYVRQKQAAIEKHDNNPNLFQRLTATLTFDSGLQPLSVGLRTTNVTGERQLFFSTKAADIMLNVQRNQTEGMTINGQILAVASIKLDACQVELITNKDTVAKIQSNPSGTFVFDEVKPNRYQLLLDIPLLDSTLSDSTLSDAISFSITIGPLDLP